MSTTTTAPYYAYELELGWTVLARGGMRTIIAFPTEPAREGWINIRFGDGLEVSWPNTREVVAIPA